MKIPVNVTYLLILGSPLSLYNLQSNRSGLTKILPGYSQITHTVIGLLEFVIFALWLAVLWGLLREKIYDLVYPHNNSEEDKGSKSISNAVATVIVAGLLLIGSLLWFDFVQHSNAAPDKKIGEYLGTLGDFFGGVLNPILTFFTFIALILTVVMQRIQLRDTKTEADENARLARLQTFETTFFNLINLHNTTVQDLRLDVDEITTTLMSFYKYGNLNSSTSVGTEDNLSNPRQIIGRAVFSAVIRALQFKLPNTHATPIRAYEIIQNQHNHVLGRYFRNLYQVLEFVEEFSQRYTEDSANTDDVPGKRYADILRAQLSSDELLLLFYNCSGKMVDLGAFREKIKKYELLEHMPLEFSNNMLKVPNFRPDIVNEVHEYLYYADTKVESTGAFGKNGAIEAYLMSTTEYDPAKPTAKSGEKTLQTGSARK